MISWNRCGNVAAILELDEHLSRKFTVFEAAPPVSPLHSIFASFGLAAYILNPFVNLYSNRW